MLNLFLMLIYKILMDLVLLNNFIHLLIAVGLLYIAYRVQNGAASEYDVYALYILGAVALLSALMGLWNDSRRF